MLAAQDQDARKVAVCIPAFNCAEFIEKTVASALAQSHPNVEVLISDDWSEDTTYELLCALEKSGSRLRVARPARHLGWIGNINFLLEKADGHYACFLGHDDLLDPHYVERLVAALESRDGVAIAFSDLHLRLQDGREFILSFPHLDGVHSRGERLQIILGPGQSACWVPYRGVFRLEDARALGGLRRNLAGEYAADCVWVFDMAATGRLLRVPEVLYFKHNRPSSLSGAMVQTRRKKLALALAMLRAILRARLPVMMKLRLGGYLVRTKIEHVAGRLMDRVRSVHRG